MIFNKLGTLALFCSGMFVYFTPNIAMANSYTFCSSMYHNFIDSGNGEDYVLGDTSYNRYGKVRITRNGSTVLGTTYLNAFGCVDFTSPHKGQFKVEFYGQTKQPAADNNSHNVFVNIRFPSGSVPKWTYYWTFGGTSGSQRFYFSASDRTNLLAGSSWVVAQQSAGLDNETINVFDKACPGTTSGSCASFEGGNEVNVYMGRPNRKFLTGHEIGHAIVEHWIDDNPVVNGSSYTADTSDNDGGSECIWTGGAHAMHTKEYSSAALVEGHAHYMATAAFNSTESTTGYFEYYKPEYKNGAVSTVNMESGSLGGSVAYMKNVCSGTKSGRGTELDWARQFWDYRTNNGTKPSEYIMLRQIKNAIDTSNWSNTNAWSRMKSGIQQYDSDNGTSFWSRWDNTDAFNGINF